MKNSLKETENSKTTEKNTTKNSKASAKTAKTTKAEEQAVKPEAPAAKPARRGRPPKSATASKKAESAKEPKERKERKERIFALDIGTRSVIGIVAEKEADGLKIVATERQEHKTRAMLDGQIHDVPQVAAIIDSVKKELIKKTGTIKSAAVAAAGTFHSPVFHNTAVISGRAQVQVRCAGGLILLCYYSM